ncbi:hypothetical protein [Phenylobacterium sp.]|jgi:anti-sigma factor RsiW|uniref:anti-sigma factor family protein n=1 Tax=Phenylobacterium sp. TaxID=1871053 RepID=UPI002F93A110
MSREERVIAYVDGELGASDAAAFERDLASDAALAAEVDQQRRLRERILSAYGAIAEEPTPDRLVLSACAANQNRRFGWRHWAAIAASLAVGVTVGFVVPHQRGALAAHDGVLVARAGLAQALETQLASDTGPIRVGLSFKDADGDYCRTFQSTPDRLAGLACRENGRWIAHATLAWSPAPAPQYRTAGSELPPAVLTAVDELIAGDPLDAAAERAARDARWRR